MGFVGFVLSAQKRFSGNVDTVLSRCYAQLGLRFRSANYVVLGVVRWPITRRINAQPSAAGPALRRLRACVPAVVRGVTGLIRHGASIGVNSS